MPVEGRQRAIAICMLKGDPQRACDICSKPDSIGGTGLLSVTRPMKPYQLPATTGNPLSFPLCITVIRIQGRFRRKENRYLTVTCHTDMMEVAPGILG